MTTIIGLDPGKSGGIAVLREGLAPMAFKMPDTESDIYHLLSGIERADGRVVAYIENVHSSPQMGVKSAFTFGMGYGGLRMALMCLGIPFTEISPGKWQREMHCSSKGDKNVTKARAQQLFPSLRITHWGADALLIAAYGFQQHQGRPFVDEGRLAIA